MSNIPKPDEIYKHFKGGLYKIIAIAQDSETGADVVVYQALYGEFKIYVRELSMFMEKVDKAACPEASQEYRFALQTGIIGQSIQQPIQQAPPAKEPGLPVKEPQAQEEPKEQEPPFEAVLDEMLIQFLDADTYGEKLNILAGLHHRITDDMLYTMALSLDLDVGEGDTNERYAQLRSCLLTLEKYERSRL